MWVSLYWTKSLSLTEKKNKFIKIQWAKILSVRSLATRFDIEATNVFRLHKSKEYIREIYELQTSVTSWCILHANSAKTEMIAYGKNYL